MINLFAVFIAIRKDRFKRENNRFFEDNMLNFLFLKKRAVSFS